MNKYLKERNADFYTFDLRLEKLLKVLLKGISYMIKEEEVKNTWKATITKFRGQRK